MIRGMITGSYSSESMSDSEEELPIEYVKQHMDPFSEWMDQIVRTDIFGKLYKEFSTKFDADFRTKLYEIIADYFGTEHVTDKIKFYWTLLIIDLMSCNKTLKYKVTIVKDKNVKQDPNELPIVSYDIDELNTNLVLHVTKHMFYCDIDKEKICWLKENGTSYYVS